MFCSLLQCPIAVLSMLHSSLRSSLCLGSSSLAHLTPVKPFSISLHTIFLRKPSTLLTQIEFAPSSELRMYSHMSSSCYLYYRYPSYQPVSTLRVRTTFFIFVYKRLGFIKSGWKQSSSWQAQLCNRHLLRFSYMLDMANKQRPWPHGACGQAQKIGTKAINWIGEYSERKSTGKQEIMEPVARPRLWSEKLSYPYEIQFE